jgi:hypothetical protein
MGCAPHFAWVLFQGMNCREINPLRTLARAVVILLALLGMVFAQANSKNKPKILVSNVPYCIEGICLNDPISKFSDFPPEKENVNQADGSAFRLADLHENYPACSFKTYSVYVRVRPNRVLKMSFYPYVDLKGMHYRVGGISEAIAENYTIDEARKIFDQKKVGRFEEVAPYPFTFSAKLRQQIKDYGDVSYYLNLKWQPEGVHILYSSEQIQNQSELVEQLGCASVTPGQ